MTHKELLQSGRDGVYRSDLDEWFFVGEEPPKPTATTLILPGPETPNTDNTAATFILPGPNENATADPVDPTTKKSKKP